MSAPAGRRCSPGVLAVLRSWRVECPGWTLVFPGGLGCSPSCLFLVFSLVFGTVLRPDPLSCFSNHNDSTWVDFHLLLPNRQFTMYQEGLRSRRSLGRAMPSSDEKRQAQQVARRLKARQLKIQTLLEKLPGARQPATTIARPTPRDYSPPAALTLVPFRQSLT